MRKTLLFLMLLSLSSGLLSQANRTKLKVYGVCPVAQEKIGETITLAFTVDKSKCDPEIGFVSMEQLLFHFEDALKVKGIDFSAFKKAMVSQVNGTVQTDEYSYVGTEQEIQDIVQICKNQEIRVKNIRARYPKITLEDQDERAICALKEVMRKAKVISSEMGYQNCDLVGIDDDSSPEGMSNLIALIMSMNLTELFGGSGGSTYSIIGHFELY